MIIIITTIMNAALSLVKAAAKGKYYNQKAMKFARQQ